MAPRRAPLIIPEAVLPPILKTLRFRLCLIITGLIALLTIAGALYIVRKASDDTRAEVRSTLNLADHFIDAELAIIRDRWQTHGYTAPRFHLQELVDVRHLSVMLYDDKGNLLETNEDYTNPNPVAPGWFTWLVRRAASPMKVQQRDISFEGRTLGRLIIAPDPDYEMEEIWATSRSLLELLLVFFVLINLFVWSAVSLAMRPLDRVLEALSQIRRGNLAARLPAFDLPEMQRIGMGFNHMAESLEQSVAANRQLTMRMMQIQESERKSLARDLHDEIGQCMSAIHADAAVIRNRGGVEIRDSAEAIMAAAGQIKRMIRSMLKRLRPPALDELGLDAALRELAGTFRERNPEIACTVRTSPQLAGLDGDVAVAMYRVLQECLTNIAVHASAHRVEIELTHDASADSRMRLTVADDGVGFPAMSAVSGFGLKGIQERVAVLGGRCEIDSGPGRGTRVSVEVPLPRLESAA